MPLAEDLDYRKSVSQVFLAGSLPFGEPPLLSMGTAEQKRRFLGPFLEPDRPRWGSFAMTEPGAGSDVAAIQTRAKRDGDHFVLDGEKSFAANASRADWIVVWATVDASLGRAGHRAFVVERGTPGLGDFKIERKMGLKAYESTSFRRSACRVPAANLIGGEAQYAARAGFKGALASFNATRPMIAAMAVGIGRAAPDAALNPTFSRDVFLEAHDLIVRAWTEPGPFEHLGKHFQYRYVNVWPRPYTKPHPPIWMPSAGSSETIEFAAQYKYPYVSVFTPIENVKRLLDSYRTIAREKFGYEPEPALLGYAPGLYVSDDDKRAQEEAEEHGKFFLSKAFKIPPHFLIPPGYVTENSLRGFLAARMGEGPTLGNAIAGTPRCPSIPASLPPAR